MKSKRAKARASQHNFSFWVSLGEKDAIMLAASAAGRSQSDYCRAKALAKQTNSYPAAAALGALLTVIANLRATSDPALISDLERLVLLLTQPVLNEFDL